MHQIEILQAENSDPLVAATIALAAQRGADGLSSRAVATFAGVAPSSINYRHGSLSGLVSAAGLAGDAARAAAWRAAMAELEELRLAPDDFGPAAFTVIRGQIERLRGEETLFWHEAIAGCRGHGELASLGALDAEAAFWSRLIERCGLQDLQADIMQGFALALRFAWLTFSKPDGFDPWAQALVMRFAERACGGHPTRATDCAWRARTEAEADPGKAGQAPGHDTAQKIIEATIALIMSQGAGAATHRAVAAKAGLSVSSVQHFFGTRSAILLAAFRSIYDAARDRAFPPQLPVASLDPDELFSTLTAGRDTSPAIVEADFAAMHGLILSAAEQDETRPIANGLIARTGATSMGVLAALKHPRGAIGRLDAQILSMTLGQTAILGLAQRSRAGTHGPGDTLADFGQRVTRALFA